MANRAQYASFLIRLWREPGGDEGWIAEAEHIPSGQRRYFDTLDALFAFIREQLPARPQVG